MIYEVTMQELRFVFRHLCYTSLLGRRAATDLTDLARKFKKIIDLKNTGRLKIWNYVLCAKSNKKKQFSGPRQQRH